MDEPKEQPKPDVVYIPHDYRIGGIPTLADLVKEFRPILGAHPHFHKVNGNDHLAHTRPKTGEPMQFAKMHPREGQPRFLFRDRGDGILYGYGVEGAYDVPAVTPPREYLAELAQAHADALAAYLAGGSRPDTSPKEMP